MAHTGWIRLHRKIREHWLWHRRRRFSHFEAWVDLLLSANHSHGKVPIGSKLIPVERGQVLTSQLSLAKRWRWNRKTVNAFLTLAKGDQILDFESSKGVDTGYTLITIRNYSKYQDRENETLDIEADNGTDIQGTMEGHPRDNNNKNKEEIKKKNIRPFSPGSTNSNGASELTLEETFEVFYRAYPKKKSRGRAEKAWKKINPTPELLKTILDAIQQAKQSREWQQENGRYILHPASWLNAKGWEDETEMEEVENPYAHWPVIVDCQNCGDAHEQEEQCRQKMS